MLDMNQPGVKVEPILTMAEDHDFNQVVFTDAIAKVKDRIGKENDGSVDYVKGSNISGFIKIADAMIDQGVV